MKKENSISFTLFLGVTAAFCGALVMVIEVMGSRVISPFFGVSLFVWTGLITVTLVALALGYALGGFISDKKNKPDYLYAIVFIAGILVMLIPLLRKPVLIAFLPFDLRMGSFLSSTVLFGPSLLLLGCISPYVVKLAAREVTNIGRVVGVLYAISTIGSFIGTVITGYVLIAYFDIYAIFFAAGLLLVAISCFYFVFFRKKLVSLLIFAILLIAVFQYREPLIFKTMPDGTVAKEVFRKETYYGTIKVIDYSFGMMHTRELLLDGQIQGGIDLNTNESIYEFSYYMGMLPYLLHPEGKSCLVIGLGAGVVPVWYEKYGIPTDIVEINPEVVHVAQTYFNFHISGDIHAQDARYFLEHAEKFYDFVVLDVFNGDTTPGHILSRESIEALKKHLTEKGILAFNLIGNLGENNYMTSSVVKTLRSVFDHVETYPIFSPEEGEEVGNIAILAHDYPFDPVSPDSLKAFSIHPMVYERVKKHFGRKFEFSSKKPSIILTDSYNPIDFWDAQLKEKIRRDIFKFTDPAMLL